MFGIIWNNVNELTWNVTERIGKYNTQGRKIKLKKSLCGPNGEKLSRRAQKRIKERSRIAI